jgi:Skp family chaperone for outer membrane proteins
MQVRTRVNTGRLKTAFFACAMAFGLALSTPSAHAADPITVGVLDEVKLGDGYIKYRNAVDELNLRAKKLEEQLRSREVLDATEGAKFDELINKATLTEEETKAFNELIQTGTERRKRYLDLSGKAERTEDENALLKTVDANRKNNVAALNQIEDGMFKDLQARERATDQEYIDKANLEVQKVAADKKLAVVLRKDAVAWFSPSVDITDEVLKRLNRQ